MKYFSSLMLFSTTNETRIIIGSKSVKTTECKFLSESGTERQVAKLESDGYNHKGFIDNDFDVYITSRIEVRRKVVYNYVVLKPKDKDEYFLYELSNEEYNILLRSTIQGNQIMEDCKLYRNSNKFFLTTVSHYNKVYHYSNGKNMRLDYVEIKESDALKVGQFYGGAYYIGCNQKSEFVFLSDCSSFYKYHTNLFKLNNGISDNTKKELNKGFIVRNGFLSIFKETDIKDIQMCVSNQHIKIDLSEDAIADILQHT